MKIKYKAPTTSCEICGKICSKSNIKRHMLLHTDDPNIKRDFQEHLICTCEFCNKQWFTTPSGYFNHKTYCYKNPNHKTKHLSKEAREKVGLAAKIRGAGGYEVGKHGGHGKRGFYKGYYCMSSWELAWLVYQLDHNINVQQCRDRFIYIFNDKSHYYTPDFKIDDTYYEIKNWHRPDTDAKLDAVRSLNKKIILIEGKDINQFLSYAMDNYGKDFVEVLYEK